MKTRLFKILTIITLFLTPAVLFSQADGMAPLSGVENTKQYRTIDLIYMDKDLSIFTNLLTLSGLNTSMALTDQAHTLFVPTNDAFTDMSIEDFAELTNPKNRTKLVEFVNRHFVSTKIQSQLLTEQKVISLDGNKVIPVSVSGYNISVGGATVVAADIETSNGIIHVVNEVITVTNRL